MISELEQTPPSKREPGSEFKRQHKPEHQAESRRHPMRQPKPPAEPSQVSSAEFGWIGDLADRAWSRLGGAVPRERIDAAAHEAVERYAGARVKTFVPILVERHFWQRLQP